MQLIKEIIKKLVPKETFDALRRYYRASVRMLYPVKLGDIKNLEPRSRNFGLTRGSAIDRYYIDKFLKSYSKYVKGNVLEVAENTYSMKYGRNIRSYILKYENNPNEIKNISEGKVVVGDLTKIETIPKNKFDCFICTQTLNFIFDVESALVSVKHMLKENGAVLATVAGLSQISYGDYCQWGDYWRFTDESARMHFERIFGKGNVKVVPYGNLASTLAFLQGFAQEDLPKGILDKTDKEYPNVIGIIAINRKL